MPTPRHPAPPFTTLVLVIKTISCIMALTERYGLSVLCILDIINVYTTYVEPRTNIIEGKTPELMIQLNWTDQYTCHLCQIWYFRCFSLTFTQRKYTSFFPGSTYIHLSRYVYIYMRKLWFQFRITPAINPNFLQNGADFWRSLS